MSRGIGKTQQRILDELKASEHGNLTVVGLAERLGASARQIRQAVHSLAGRELVVLTKEGLGWQGEGKIGRAVPRKSYYGEHIPTAFVVRKGERWPIPDAYGDYRKVAACDVEFIRIGTPTGVSLVVWLPEKRASYLENLEQQSETMGRMFGQPGNGARNVAREKAKETR